MGKQEYLRHPEGSIYSAGYGIVPKAVMQSQDLSIEAKAIYAYLCSFMGAGDTAFPSIKKICYDLGINIKRYYRHIDQLVEGGYITKTRVYYKATGQWANIVYTINYEANCIEAERVTYNT